MSTSSVQPWKMTNNLFGFLCFCKAFKAELDKLGYKDKFVPVKCDITDEKSVVAAFQKIATIGKLSILINNAGVCPRVPIHGNVFSVIIHIYSRFASVQ